VDNGERDRSSGVIPEETIANSLTQEQRARVEDKHLPNGYDSLDEADEEAVIKLIQSTLEEVEKAEEKLDNIQNMISS
jgi:hypothetical protein